MNDTPRTDAVVNSLPQNDRGEITFKGIRNLINCCADLERELAEAREKTANDDGVILRLIEERNTAREQRDHYIAENNRLLDELKAERKASFSDEIAEVTKQRYEAEQRAAIAESNVVKIMLQRDDLATACASLIDSPDVQASWPMNGNNRAEKPSETFSSAETKVKFRHLLRIHAALAAVKGGTK